MSEPSAAAEPALARRVFVASAILLGAVAFVLSMVGFRGGELDPVEVLGEVFEHPDRTLPFELELHEAALLPDGQRLVRMVHPDWVEGFGPSSEADEPPVDGDDVDDGDDGTGGTDAPEEPAEDEDDEVEPILGGAPVEVLVVLYGKPEPVRKLFENTGGSRVMSDHVGEGGPGGGPGGIDKGPKVETVEVVALGWSKWRANAIRQRAELGGGHFRESVRVNLSRGDRYEVLFAHWAPDHRANFETLTSLLRSLELREAAESASEPKAASEDVGGEDDQAGRGDQFD